MALDCYCWAWHTSTNHVQLCIWLLSSKFVCHISACCGLELDLPQFVGTIIFFFQRICFILYVKSFHKNKIEFKPYRVANQIVRSPVGALSRMRIADFFTFLSTSLISCPDGIMLLLVLFPPYLIQSSLKHIFHKKCSVLSLFWSSRSFRTCSHLFM